MPIYEHHDTVGLNNYECNYFKKHFGNNLKRLALFRKVIAHDQKYGWYRGEVGTSRSFMTKGNKYNSIWLSKKKIDAYIREITNKNK